MKTASVIIRDEEFIMHPLRTLFWEQKGILLIADLHLGKVSHFRKAGIAVPRAALHENFRNLDSVIDHFKPGSVCFLGDLFHSKANSEWDLLKSFLHQYRSIDFTLVAGNHDVYTRERQAYLGLNVFEKIEMDGFNLTHEATDAPGCYNLCGHIHPGIVLRGKGLSSERLPCFFISPERAILPSFGKFTGMEMIKAGRGDRVFVVTPEEVFEVR